MILENLPNSLFLKFVHSPVSVVENIKVPMLLLLKYAVVSVIKLESV